ncbi:MAG: 5-formyltetrahydrofolate cyclo-ligase, partial [Parafannyhessea umbonata]
MDGKGTRERKRELRRRYKEVRGTLGKDGRARRDAAIADGVTRLPEYLAADTVLTYLSVGDEVDTRSLVRDAWAQGKSVALPWCVPGTRRMRWFLVSSLDGLVRS